MKIRNALAAAAIAVTLVTVAGCAVGRGQQTAGAYVDDSAITARSRPACWTIRTSPARRLPSRP